MQVSLIPQIKNPRKRLRIARLMAGLKEFREHPGRRNCMSPSFTELEIVSRSGTWDESRVIGAIETLAHLEARSVMKRSKPALSAMR
jgi:hypothetical protein